MIAPPGAYQSVESHDFPGAHIETDVFEHALSGKIFYFQHGIPDPDDFFGENIIQLTPDHHINQRIPVEGFRLFTVDIFPVPQYRHRIRDLENLLQPV